MRRLPALIVSLWIAAAPPAGEAQRRPDGPGAPLRFVVLGDSRGDASGAQPPVFREILRLVDGLAPALVVHTGDMVYGYTLEDSVLRRYWAEYRAAVSGLRAPLWHVPGNHDLFDAHSAAVYRELWGPPYRAFDHRGVRFVLLDTETDPGRLGAAQLEWLRSQLREAPGRVFVFLHQPLFPVDGHLGAAMDRYPEERDRLHELLVRHRERVAAVFQGHEHLYSHEQRDGIHYYITGGGGSPLYVPPELGGFHHFLVVEVDSAGVSVDVRRVGIPEPTEEAPRAVLPGRSLEGWERTLFWESWDHGVVRELSRGTASEGRQALEVWLDFARTETPVVYLAVPAPGDLRGVSEVSVDLHVPRELAGALTVSPGVQAKAGGYTAEPVPLRAGWNTVTLALDSPGLRDRLDAVEQVGWTLGSTRGAPSGRVVFDNFRTRSREPAAPGRGAPTPLREGWEGDLLWGAWDAPTPVPTAEHRTEGEGALRMQLDFAAARRPRLYARLDPAWDLSRVQALLVDVYLPPGTPGVVTGELALTAGEQRYATREVVLRPGWNVLRADLAGAWLPAEARARAELLELVFSGPSPTLRGWIAVDHLRSTGR